MDLADLRGCQRIAIAQAKVVVVRPHDDILILGQRHFPAQCRVRLHRLFGVEGKGPVRTAPGRQLCLAMLDLGCEVQMDMAVLGKGDEEHRRDHEEITRRFEGSLFNVRYFTIMDRAGHLDIGERLAHIESIEVSTILADLHSEIQTAVGEMIRELASRKQPP